MPAPSAELAPAVEPPAVASATGAMPEPPPEGDGGGSTGVDAAPTNKKRIVSPRGTKLANGAWLAAPCVDPVLDVAARRNIHLPDMFTADDTVDIDGDGTADLTVYVDAASIVSTRAFYVRRGSCGHFVGMISSTANLSFTDARARGLRQLSGRSRCQVTCCPGEVIETWAFDGVAFRKIKAEKLPPCEKPRLIP